MNVLLPYHLSFSNSVSTPHPQCQFLTMKPTKPMISKTIIRMGGGPRTYPGGVSKWQWKRMQANKAKQLLKARLSRERQIYEMRKRAELKAAVSELERPWEAVERAPKLFSLEADEQVKVLADRFQKPGGFDMWTLKDGPQLFESPDELPSARFFPKGVVHSVRPYRRVTFDDDDTLSEGVDGGEEWSSGSLTDGRNGGGVDGFDEEEGSSAPWSDGRRFLVEDVDGDDQEEEEEEEWSSAHLSNERIGGSVGGRMRRTGNWNGRRFLPKDVDASNDGESSSPLNNYGRNGVNGDGRMRKNGNGRRFVPKGVVDGYDDGENSSPLNNYGNGRRYLSEGVDGADEEEGSSAPFSSGRNGGRFDGRLRRNGNGRRFVSKDVDGSNYGESSTMNYERNGDGRMRKNGNGRRLVSKDVDGSNYGESSTMNYGRNGDGRMRKNGNGRRFVSKDVDGSNYAQSSSSMNYGRNGDGRIRNKGNGRRFVSKDVGGSHGLASPSGRVGSGWKHRGSDSFAGRSGAKYARENSGYASRRVREADSEVYDMDLKRDGSYGFHQKSEQSDSKNW